MGTSFAISGSKDGTCIVWDYLTGESLRTFLLPLVLSLALDPADRAFYAGYEDGSIQKIEILQTQRNRGQDILRSEPLSTPVQPSLKDRWQSNEVGSQAALALDLSFDGTSLISGHQDGKIFSWDVAKGSHAQCIFEHFAPVTNISVLPPRGFPGRSACRTKVASVLKPRIGETFHGLGNDSQRSIIPRQYHMACHFFSDIAELPSAEGNASGVSLEDFDSLLSHPNYPTVILNEGVQAFSSPAGAMGSSWSGHNLEANGLNEEVEKLRKQLDASRKLCAYSTGHMEKLNNELRWLQRREEARRKAKEMQRMKKAQDADRTRRRAMGEAVEDSADGEDEKGDEDMEEVSTTTDEMSVSE